jgi:hypothetical protein
MAIFARNKGHRETFSTSIIPLVRNVVQKKVGNVSFLDCVHENISEVESSDSDNEIGNKRQQVAQLSDDGVM